MRRFPGPRTFRTAAAALAATLAVLPAAVALAQGPSAPPRGSGGLTYAQSLAPDALMRVQDRLRQLGVYGGRVDGVWGPDSQAALERFQQSRGLQVTGQLNEATAATLGLRPAELLEASRGGPAAPDRGAGAEAGPAAALAGLGELSPGAVRAVQARLRALGFYRGGVDGIWGPATQAAVQRFQEGRALQPTGQLNPATVQALGLDPGRPAAGAAPAR
jgi:peptidoglycan hydrolase-like protein with peptidoglycan-binding domain